MEFYKLVIIAIYLVGFAPFLKWLLGRMQFAKIVDAIPGPKAYPIIGTMWQFFGAQRSEIFEKICENVRTYPDIHRQWTGMTPEVRLTRVEYVEPIMSSSKQLKKAFIYKFLEPWLGKGLLTADGPRWHAHRKIITPTFHFSILENFSEVFAEKSDILVKRLEKHCGTGEAFNIYPYITKAALDIICESAMGTTVNAQTDEENEYVRSVYKFSELMLQRFVRPWLHNDFIFRRSEIGKNYYKAIDTLHSFSKSVIQSKRLARQKTRKTDETRMDDDNAVGKKKRLAFLDLLLASNDNEQLLTDDDIREEVDTFMFEGHDTTTAGISWALYLIGLDERVQDQIMEEMTEIFNGSDRSATFKDLNEMKYLERVIKETLRLFPSVAWVGRTLLEDVEIGGYKIPKNCVVELHIYHIHRDERVAPSLIHRHYPDPEKFDPDRFLPEHTAKRHPYAYIPFSAGPRNCIGQKFAVLEEKAVLSSILRKYKIKSIDSRTDMRIVNELIVRPLGGINMILEKR